MTAIVRRTLRDHSRLHTLTNRIISRIINPNSTSNNSYSQRIKEDSQHSSSSRSRSRYNHPIDVIPTTTTSREDRDRPLILPIHQQHYFPSTISYGHLCNLPPPYFYQDHHQQQLDCYDSTSASATSRRHDSVQTNIMLAFSPPFVTLSTSSSSVYHNNRRWYHTTPKHERYTAIVMTLGAVAATAKAGQYALQAYREWQDHSPNTTTSTASDTITSNAMDTEFQQQQQQSHESGNMKGDSLSLIHI